MWFGGFCGSFYVWTTIMSGPRIGAALAVSLAIAGQLIVAAVLDHTGALGFPQHALSPLRLGGIALVIAGVSPRRLFEVVARRRSDAMIRALFPAVRGATSHPNGAEGHR